ncbi:MAG: hypothetical protein DRI57_19870 [Deltaproteobacteria bacterium]|nr:MAG: hypothetical protein DRI57_19870 [Deltaproteobacteria bacterium]
MFLQANFKFISDSWLNIQSLICQYAEYHSSLHHRQWNELRFEKTGVFFNPLISSVIFLATEIKYASAGR